MKKYPFSKKAVKAMIIASLAFTPAASFGAVQAQAADSTVVNYSSVEELINRVDKEYDMLSPTQKTYLEVTVQPKLATIITNKIPGSVESIFSAEVISVEGNQAKAEQLLTAVVGLTTAQTKADLESKIGAFKLSQKENVTDIFGPAITVQMVLDYIADVEVEYLNSIEANKAVLMKTIISSMFSNENISLEDMTTMLNNAGISIDIGDITNRIVVEKENIDAIIDEIIEDVTIKDIVISNITLSTDMVSVIADVLGSTLEDAMVTVGSEHTEINTALEDELASKSAIKALFKEVVNAYFAPEQTQPPGGGGGGGGVTPPNPGQPGKVITLPEAAAEVVREKNPSGKIEVVTKVPAEQVTGIVNLITTEKNVVPLKLEKPAAGEQAKAQVPAALFTEAVKKNDKAVVEVQTEEASYKLPAKEINVTALAAKLGVEASDVQITISVNVVDAADVKDSIDNNKLKTVSKIIEFTVKAVSGDKSESISTFSTYVEREITGEANFNANKSTAVRLNEDGTFSSIPTLFNGKTATIKSRTNSKYTIVENDKTFTDVNNGKTWAEAHIEKLASKYIIKGKTEELYAPKADITRGEFALLITRSLGLVAEDPNSSKFPDVQANKGLNVDNEITAAYEAGFIQGFPDGTFKPNDKITRADASMIIARALEFTDVPNSKFDTTKKVTNLKDHASFRYAKDSIEKVYQAGIVEGHETGKFGASEFTTREQMAKVVDKFLQVSNFIN